MRPDATEHSTPHVRPIPRLLFNECIALDFLHLIRGAGYDGEHIIALGKGENTDPDNLALSASLWRVLVTEDREFNQIFWNVPSPHPGVVKIRIRNLDWRDVADVFLRFLRVVPPSDLEDSLTIVRRQEYEIRRRDGSSQKF